MNRGNVMLILLVVVALAAGGVFVLTRSGASSEGESMVKGVDAAMEAKAAMEAQNAQSAAMVKDEAPAMEKKEAGAMMEKKPEGAMEKLAGETMMKKGSYEAYAPEKVARAAEGKVVLFFRASWCPTCRGLDANIKANLASIPAGTTILDADYDNSTALKQKYGVTYQHTLVQVDAQGNQVAKWQGSQTLAALLVQVK